MQVANMLIDADMDTTFSAELEGDLMDLSAENAFYQV
jgi:hypothetical protein